MLILPISELYEKLRANIIVNQGSREKKDF
jgi:hypothetical protein